MSKAYLKYVARVILQIDTEIAEKGHFCSEIMRGPPTTSAYLLKYRNIAVPAV